MGQRGLGTQKTAQRTSWLANILLGAGLPVGAGSFLPFHLPGRGKAALEGPSQPSLSPVPHEPKDR